MLPVRRSRMEQRRRRCRRLHARCLGAAVAHVLVQGEFAGSVMHGRGCFMDAQGRKWAGQFFNGSGPGLTHQLE